MSELNPYGGSRAAGGAIFVVSIATLIIAAVNTPLGEWGTWGWA